MSNPEKGDRLSWWIGISLCALAVTAAAGMWSRQLVENDVSPDGLRTATACSALFVITSVLETLIHYRKYTRWPWRKP